MIPTLATVATTLFTGLSADIKSYSYLESFRSTDWGHPSEQFDVCKSFMLYKNIEYDIIDSIADFGYDNLDINVKRNTINILDKLSSIFKSNISNENLYPSSYGTFIIECENSDSIFSLEIGKSSIGYFSEIHGKTIHFQEEVNIENFEDLDIVIGEVNKAFFDFHSKI